MVRSRISAFVGVGFVILFARSADAQSHGEFGEKGQLIFSADRLVPVIGYTNNKVTNDDANTSTSTSGGAVSLFYGNNSAHQIETGAGLAVDWGSPTFYTTPRLGFDYALLQRFTIGGNFVLAFPTGGSVSQCTGNNCQTADASGGNVWGLAPRVGYVAGITDLVAIWLRGGLSYYHSTTSATGGFGPAQCPAGTVTYTSGVFGLDLDPQLVISPVNHFAFEIGPTLDWGFAGNVTQEQPNPTGPCGSTVKSSGTYTSLFFGVTGGIFGWF